MRQRIAIAAAALLVGAVGCGGDGGGGDGGGGGNGGNELPDYLCDLFTVEEIEAIVDRPLEQDDEISNNLVCKWNDPALGYHGYGAHVEFLPGYAYGFDGHISHIEEVWETEAVPVSDIGEKAALIRFDHHPFPPEVTLYVAAGRDMFAATVRDDGITIAEAEPLVRELMLLFLDRI